MISTQEIERLIDGGTVLDQDNNKIGKIEQIYLDDQSSEPEWVTVKTGFFGGAASFVPLRDARVQGEDLVVPFTKDKVKDAPRIEDSEGHLSRDGEVELYGYYGRDYAETSGTADRNDTNTHDSHNKVEGNARSADHDATMTRSEEQLNVGTEQVSGGKVRLRKHVVTENVTTTVPVSHEEVRVEREPITAEDRESGATHGDNEIGSDDAEIELTEERVVVTKETVPVEKVSLGTDTVTEEQTVSEEVRKEQIDTDTATTDGHSRNKGH